MSTIPEAEEKTKNNIKESALKLIELGGKKFGLKLDFSEDSVVIADDLITLFFKDRKSHYIRAATFIGSFLGEVIITNLGGKWQQDLSIRKVGHTKSIAHPMLRAQKRLAFGMEDSLSNYYRALKQTTCGDGSLSNNSEKVKKAHEKLRAAGWDQKLLKRILNEGEKKYAREEAAELLGRIGDEKIVPALIKALASPKSAYYACIVLQGIPDNRAFEPLMETLKKSRTPGVRMQAAIALGALRDERAVDALVCILAEEDEILCHYASVALGMIGGEKAINMLLEIMSGLRQGNIIYAISALEGIGDKKAVPALIEAIFSRDEDIKESAAKALQQIPDRRAYKPLLFLLQDPSYKIRTIAAYALVNIGETEEVIPFLKSLLKDDTQSVRHHADKLIQWIESGKTGAGIRY